MDPSSKNACERFIDELVGRCEPLGWYNRFRAGVNLIVTVRNNLKSGVNSRELDVEGFKHELVNNNQRGQAIRHMRVHAGCLLFGFVGMPPSIGLHLMDWMQARKGRPESETEMRDNLAGREVGKLMVRRFKEEFTPDELRVELRRILAA